MPCPWCGREVSDDELCGCQGELSVIQAIKAKLPDSRQKLTPAESIFLQAYETLERKRHD